jgi:hypothetical protein
MSDKHKIIDDFGDELRLKAIASKGRKIHLVLLNKYLQPYEATLCHRGALKIKDEEDDVKDIHKLKAILTEKRICKQCKKDIKLFVSEQLKTTKEV